MRWQNLATVVLPYLFRLPDGRWVTLWQQWETYLYVGIVPLGLALAWALLAVVNVGAFGWQLPMYLFPLDYLRLGALALLAAALAALWPAWRLSRMPPAQLLGVFRNER